MAALWAELKRRNVSKVALFYIVASWLLLQVAELLFDILDLPTSWLRAILAILLLGFPIALVVSWIYELTPKGLTRESDIDRSQPIGSTSGRRLNVAIIVLVTLAIGILLADRFYWQRDDSVAPQDAISAAATVDDDIPIVAVLPFKATGSEDGGFLAGGLHDDLITRLAKLDAFRVISRTSVMEYADTTKNMRQIGKELNARYVLEGGVQALGSRVRVNAQLIDTNGDEHIWADTFDHELTAVNIFDIQATLAVAIATEIRANLSESDRLLIDQVPTQSIAAYNAYLRGLEQRDRGGHNELNNPLTIAAFEEAVNLDPTFALAWAQLSIERSRDAQGSNESSKRELALVALERARLLQPDLHEVESARVVFLYRAQFEYALALDALEALAERESLNAAESMLRAYLFRRLGRWEDAYRSALEAQAMDPRSVATAANLISLAWESGHCEEASDHARTGMSLAPSSEDMLTQVALYELNCNGDEQYANQLLKNVAFTGYLQILTARGAAKAARDYPRMLELSTHAIPQGDDPAIQVLDQLFRVKTLRYLGQSEAAEAELAAAGEALRFQKTSGGDSWLYAAAMSAYHTMQGDADSLRSWLEETERRRDQQTKRDFASAAFSIRIRAEDFAYLGLHDEAIEELRRMVRTPGAARMPFVNLLPEFDGIRNDPDYIALLDQNSD